MSRPDIRAGLDTSVLIRLLTADPAPEAASAYGYLAEIEEAGAALLVSNQVVSEAYFACQHYYGMPKSEVLQALLELLSQPTFVVQPGLLELLAMKQITTAKPGFVDRLIHSEYAAINLPLVTFEKSATRLAGTKILAVGCP